MKAVLTLAQIAACASVLAGTTAILSPVLIQRDRASADLSNAKQLAVGTIIYSADADDLFPLAYAPGPGNSLRAEAPLSIRDASTPFHWAAAIQPYLKNVDLYAAVGAPRKTIRGEPDPAAPVAGHAFNGLLHALSAAEVETPGETVLFSQTLGFVNTEGWAHSNPVLDCVPGEPCRYVPSADGCNAKASGATSRLRAFSVPQSVEEELADGPANARVQVFARTDGSAKTLRFDRAKTTAPYPADRFFWSRLTPDHRAASLWTDAHGCHPLRFRPDYKREDDESAREIPK